MASILCQAMAHCYVKIKNYPNFLVDDLNWKHFCLFGEIYTLQLGVSFLVHKIQTIQYYIFKLVILTIETDEAGKYFMGKFDKQYIYIYMIVLILSESHQDLGATETFF